MGTWSPGPGATSGNDTFTGGGGADIANGLGGDDVLEGADGADFLRGGAGNDIIWSGFIGGPGRGDVVADTLSGETGDDHLVGDIYDTFDGGDGVDSVGLRGRPEFYDAPQHFTLDLSPLDMGDDIMLPGGGVIRANVEQINVVLYHFGIDINNEIITNEDVYTIIGSSGVDSVTSSGGDDNISGRGGDDYLDGFFGNDELSGDAGNDGLFGGDGEDTIRGGEGNDNIVGAGPSLLGPGVSDADSLSGEDGNDSIYANAGDTIDGGDGTDVLTFYFGSKQRVSLNLSGVSLSSGVYSGAFAGTADGGDNVVVGSIASIESLSVSFEFTPDAAGKLSYIGGAFADSVSGSGGADSVAGNAGEDSLSGLGGDDYLFGGADDDLLVGGDGDDVLEGGAGVDSLTGDLGSDTASYASSNAAVTIDLSLLSASGGDADGDFLLSIESLKGSAYNDVLRGDANANVLDGYTATDLLYGGAGADTYIVNSSTDQAIEDDSGGGIDLVKSSASWTLGDFLENLTLTGSKAVNGTGNALANILTGNGADNVLRGLNGADTLDGYVGNDTLYGGAGDDTYIVNSSTDRAVEDDAGGGVDLVKSNTSWVLGNFIENLTLTGSKAVNATGNGLDNIVAGNNAANVLDGYTGTDTLIGGGGNDTYIVNSSTDRAIEDSAGGGVDLVKSTATWMLGANLENLTLTGAKAVNGSGNALDNVIIGNSAANIIAGAGGHDTLTGGAGADAFVFASGSVKNSDTITDFAVGVDKIRLDNAVFAELSEGALSGAAFYTGAAAHDADDRVIYNAATGNLYYDGDGNGASRGLILLATIAAHPALTAGDFTVI